MATLGILTLPATGHLQFWHLYVAAVLNGLGNTFQWPVYSAAISTMLPKQQNGRANGMMSLVESGPGVFAPLMAGAPLPLIGLRGVLTLDVATFFLAIGALSVVHIPQPIVTLEGQKGGGSLWKEAAYGVRYIFAWTVFAPLILSGTGNDSIIFGSVKTAAAIGGVAGGILMSAWGGSSVASTAFWAFGLYRTCLAWWPSVWARDWQFGYLPSCW